MKQSTQGGGVSSEARLEEVVLAWLEACRAGWAPDRSRFLAAYPDIRKELAEFIEGQAALSGLGNSNSGPVRDVLAANDGDLGTLGDFRLIREIGRGGMGVVYEAEQITLRRRVALKVLPFAAAMDHRQLERFRNEALAAANLRHDHIVPVFAVGMERGVHFYAMQYIEGQSLANLVETLRAQRSEARGEEVNPSSGGGDKVFRADATTAPALHPSQMTPANSLTLETSLPPTLTRSIGQGTRNRHRWVAELGRQAAGALEHAHQMGVVHRDIKPANLLLDGRGELWVADFGLARVSQDPGLTRTGEILGTLRYASPEQAQARPGVVDQRTDIYSLGATLYELLTLQPLFDGKDRNALLAQISRDEPIPPRKHDPSIPVELETIVLKAAAKERDDRYLSARELAEDLSRFLDDRPILAKPPSLLERATKMARRHRAVTVTATGALVLLLIGLATATVMVGRAYEGERKKAGEANQQRLLAEKSFRQAREAVEQLVSISEEYLASVPQVEPVRRRLLEVALAYYEDFLAQASDDPQLQEELETSQERVKAIVAELTALSGAAQFRHLWDPRVQKELQLTPEQIAEVERMGERLRDSFRQELRNGGIEGDAERMALARDQELMIKTLLTGEQRKRLDQILLQFRGPVALLEPEVADKLGLNPEQRKELKTLVERAVTGRTIVINRENRREMGEGGPPRGGPPGNGATSRFVPKMAPGNMEVARTTNNPPPTPPTVANAMASKVEGAGPPHPDRMPDGPPPPFPFNGLPNNAGFPPPRELAFGNTKIFMGPGGPDWARQLRVEAFEMLTPEQMETWKSMIGKPFRPGRGFGPGGPGFMGAPPDAPLPPGAPANGPRDNRENRKR